MQYRPHRYQTEFPIKLRSPAGSQKGKVIDVNNTGARIEGLHNLRRGDKVQFSILYHNAEAVVQWISHGFVGVTFRPQITDDQVDTLRYRRDGRVRLSAGSLVEMR
jgi:hypothetical protein